MTTSLQITKEVLPEGVLMLSLKGSLGSTTACELETVFDDCFNQGIYKLIVDLSQLDHLDSIGAGVFINARPTAQENNGGLVLLQPQFEAREILNLLEASQPFMIADTRTTALQGFASKNRKSNETPSGQVYPPDAEQLP